MKKNSHEAYIAAIRSKYEEKKNGVGSNYSFLMNPTPAQLRNLCLLLFNDNKNPDDLYWFKTYWKFESNVENITSLFNKKMGKFKAIHNFLKGGGNPKDWSTVEMIAILVELPERPYKKFKDLELPALPPIVPEPTTPTAQDNDDDTDSVSQNDQNKIDNLSDTVSKPSNPTDGPDTIIIGTPGNDTRETKKEEEESKKPAETESLNTEGDSNRNYEDEDTATGIMTFIHPPVIVSPKGPNKWYLTMGALIVMVVLVWGLNKTVFTPKNCMIWMEDHYEKIDCNNPEINGYSVKLDEELLEHFRKVSYSDTLTFFNLYGKPLIWYSKSNGVYELFTYHGLHPVTGKTLKPITETIRNNLNSNPNQ
jgi:hypothetical protein